MAVQKWSRQNNRNQGGEMRIESTHQLQVVQLLAAAEVALFAAAAAAAAAVVAAVVVATAVPVVSVHVSLHVTLSSRSMVVCGMVGVGTDNVSA